MKNIELKYISLTKVDPSDFKALLNKQKTREHLVEHDLFDSKRLKSWIEEKLEMDRVKGCKVRGILANDIFAGWCGIQYLDEQYEIAIVLDPKYWGLGIRVFKDVMRWAKELGHDVVFIHLLHTRPEYKFLRKVAQEVYYTNQLGSEFTTYKLNV